MQSTFIRRVKSYVLWRSGQLRQLPGHVGNLLFGTLYNDLLLSRKTRVTSGGLGANSRFAIFTIYPAAGLWPSHFDTLNALKASGLTPVVVSNLPLAADQRTALAEHSWQVIERQNFGYDFGAYRAGVLFLQSSRQDLTELVLVNDSVWFPVGPGDWLRAAHEADVDFFGAVSNGGIRFADAVAGTAPKWSYDPSLDNFHYCSFALRIGPRMLKDPEFWRFWRRFRLTNDKYKTIGRGEVGLSKWVFAQGYSHGCSYPVADLGDLIESKNPAEIRQLASGLIIPEDPRLRAEKNALTAAFPHTSSHAGAEQVGQLRSFILRAIERTGPAYAHPSLAIRELGWPFLKKSPLWLDPECREITLRVLGEFCPVSYGAEARALLEKRGLS